MIAFFSFKLEINNKARSMPRLFQLTLFAVNAAQLSDNKGDVEDMGI
jgi:hypothetical protein